jgi:hypothetical protein
MRGKHFVSKILFCLIVIFAGQSCMNAQTCQAPNPLIDDGKRGGIIVPVSIVNGAVLVPVTINGPAFELLLDSGFEDSVLDVATA